MGDQGCSACVFADIFEVGGPLDNLQECAASIFLPTPNVEIVWMGVGLLRRVEINEEATTQQQPSLWRLMDYQSPESRVISEHQA